MAAYENEGFCPRNEFHNFYFDEGVEPTPIKQKILEILGKRIPYMVYAENKYAWRAKGPCSIVDAMLGGDGFLGMELACLLKTLTPVVTDKMPIEKWPKFLIADHLNPHDICKDLCPSSEDKRWSFFVNDMAIRNDPVTYLNGKHILYDDRYLVVVDETEARNEQPVVKIQLFKMPK